nr:hypothetical protein [Methanobacterium sp. SMA-27]
MHNSIMVFCFRSLSSNHLGDVIHAGLGKELPAINPNALNVIRPAIPSTYNPKAFCFAFTVSLVTGQ